MTRYAYIYIHVILFEKTNKKQTKKRENKCKTISYQLSLTLSWLVGFHTNKRPFYSINCFNSDILSAIATILSLKLLEIFILYCTSFFVTYMVVSLLNPQSISTVQCIVCKNGGLRVVRFHVIFSHLFLYILITFILQIFNMLDM